MAGKHQGRASAATRSVHPAAGSANPVPHDSQGPWVVEEFGITIYPPTASNRYYQVIWHEEGRRRSTSGGTSLRSAEIKADTIARRLESQAFQSERPFAELVDAWLAPDRPRPRPWSIKHAQNSKYLADRFLRPVLGSIRCSALTSRDLQRAVNRAPTLGESARVRGQLGTILRWGYGNGYLVTSPERLMAGVHAPSAPTPAVQDADEIAVEPADVPTSDAIEALALGMQHVPAAQPWDSLAVHFDTYSGLRLGELLSVRASDIDLTKRRVGVNRQVIEAKGGLVLTPPKGNKRRTSVFPTVTPEGFHLADALEERVQQVRSIDHDGLLFPAPKGGLWAPSNFGERRFRPAARIAWWPVKPGSSVYGSYGDLKWTMHSLRHRFATWLLWDRGASAADVSTAMGHADVSITLRIYGSRVSEALDRLAEIT